MKILLVDDKVRKIQKIMKVIMEVEGISKVLANNIYDYFHNPKQD